jgi:hypothetical protein
LGISRGSCYNLPVRIQSRVLLAIVVLLVLASPGISRAGAEIVVANGNDAGPGSLRQAIADATPGETIALPAGTYTLTSKELLIEKSLTIAGHGAGDTIVRAGGPFRVFYVFGSAAAVTISGVTIRDGRGTGGGGGLLNVESSLTLRDVAVTANVASADGEPGVKGGVATGGGIYSATGSLHIFGSTVTDNRVSAIGGSGKEGGIAQGGGIATLGDFTIEGSTISSNTADARGGQGPASAEQKGGLVQGAGVFAIADSSSIGGSTVSGNLADSRAGPGGGGGLIQGVGLFLLAGNSQGVMSKITVAGNVGRGSAGAFSQGGGIFIIAGTGPVSIASATVAGNSLDQAKGEGGNLYLLGGEVIPTLHNSIVSGGVGSAGKENCALKAKSLGFNLESMDQCGFGTPGDQVNQDPQLGPLQDNGGPTRTMALAATSPAVDQGSAPGQLTDQRGVLRPIDFPAIPNPNVSKADGSDIGAFELQPSNALVLGKLRRNKKKGTATLVVRVPVPANGTVVLFGKGLRKKSKAVADSGVVKLPVVGRRKVKRALRRRGKRKILIKVSYTPTGNEALTKSRKVKLLRRHRKPKH